MILQGCFFSEMGYVANAPVAAVISLFLLHFETGQTAHPRHWHFYCGHRPTFECMFLYFDWPCWEYLYDCGMNAVFVSIARSGKLPALGHGAIPAVSGYIFEAVCFIFIEICVSLRCGGSCW